jgi:hypothetical protein
MSSCALAGIPRMRRYPVACDSWGQAWFAGGCEKINASNENERARLGARSKALGLGGVILDRRRPQYLVNRLILSYPKRSGSIGGAA